MSDMAECFFNAWLEVMGKNESYPQHLFCSWHVDRAWQSNLTKISDKEKRAEVYKILKVLQQETPMIQFSAALTNTLSYMFNDEKTKNFATYFRNQYGHNFRKWAYCFRAEAGINTNMHLESMHKVIKYFYLERRTVKRLDKGLNVLKYVRDKSVERIIRLSKGEHTKGTKWLSQNHKEAVKHNNDYTITTNTINQSWCISKNQKLYSIHRLLDMKCCEQICLFCEACSHMFSCDCKFYLENRAMCKHIHLILNKVQTENQSEPKYQSNHDISNELLDLHVKKIHKSDHKISNIKDLAERIENLNFEMFDDEIIDKIHYHLMIATNLTNFSSDNPYKKFDSTNSSKKRLIEPQLRFTSTKKKCVKSRTSLKRATLPETISIKNNLHSASENYLEALRDHDYC